MWVLFNIASVLSLSNQYLRKPKIKTIKRLVFPYINIFHFHRFVCFFGEDSKYEFCYTVTNLCLFVVVVGIKPIWMRLCCYLNSSRSQLEKSKRDWGNIIFSSRKLKTSILDRNKVLFLQNWMFFILLCFSWTLEKLLLSVMGFVIRRESLFLLLSRKVTLFCYRIMEELKWSLAIKSMYIFLNWPYCSYF